MGDGFRKLFNIYPGEEKKAFLFALLGMLWALSVTCGVKFADALFLIHVGSESLPTVYGLSACGNLLAASFMLYGFHVVSPTRLFLTVIFLGILFYTTAYFCIVYKIGYDNQWLWYSLKVFGWVFYTVVVTSFWTFIDQYYHFQDAKRFYGFFSSSVFIGLATTGGLMRSGALNPQHLIFMIISLLTITFFWIRFISKKLVVIPDDSESEGGTNEPLQSFRTVIRGILASPFTILLMTANLLVQILTVMTEYNYLSDFALHFNSVDSVTAGNEENAALTLFLGQCIAVVSICNLIFGVFLYSRFVRRFGISTLAAWTPIALFVAFSGWLLSDALFFSLVGFFIVEGMMYVIDDCNFTLLLNAVPSKLKYKVRIAIESFFEPIGMLSSALLLSFVSVDSKLMGLGLSVVALVVALSLKKQYFKGIYKNLAENAVHFQRSVGDWWNSLPPKGKKAAESRLLAILKQGDDETSQLLACEGLLAFEDSTVLPKLLTLTNHLSTKAKIKFIDLIGQSNFYMDSRLLDHLHQWLYENPERQLRDVIYFYLAQHGLLHPEKVMGDLYSDDLTLQGTAILALKKSWAFQPPTTAALNRTLAAQHLERMLNSDNDEEISMGLKILSVDPSPHDVDLMIPFLKKPSLRVARAAAHAIANSIDQQGLRYAPVLINQLTISSDNECRLACLKALGNIGDTSLVKEIITSSIHFRPSECRLTESIILRMGLRTVPILLSMTKDTSLHDRCRVLSGRILGRLALPQLRANLYEIINIEIERAYFYFYHHHIIQKENPTIDLRLLQDALLTGYHSVIDFIIQLLGIAGSIEDCELLSRSLRSRNPKVRSQVVETLEKACDPKIFGLLQPLVTDLPLEEKLKAYRRGGRTPLSLTELLDRLDNSSSLADQIMSATLQYHLDLPNWRQSIRQQMPTNEEIFHQFAYELLET